MVSVRKDSSKPNHPGRYRAQRKQQKARNHSHEFIIVTKTNGRKMNVCTIPQCKEKHYI
jgi:hypothetical protein